MSGLTIGAVGAALIAGLISLIGLIISKEQKTSEFRQAWIDELRKCMISYLSAINAISDQIRVDPKDTASLGAHYKELNQANHGIILRVNEKELPAIALLRCMTEFESLAEKNSTLTPEKIRSVEQKFLTASKNLLKFEWKRVKRGEMIFALMKHSLWIGVVIASITMGAAVLKGGDKRGDGAPVRAENYIYPARNLHLDSNEQSASSPIQEPALKPRYP